MKNLIIPFLLFPATSVSQTIHQIPYASSGNVIELAVENVSKITQPSVTVKASLPPAWLRFESQQSHIGDIASKSEGAARFVFGVDKSAPVNSEQSLSFTITGKQDQTWTKTITIIVAAPDRFELFQNYPNPFNPATTISYQLTSPSKVHLVVYNLLGQEVATLAEGEREAGFHQETWSSSSLSSGVYIYRITAIDRSGNKIVQNKTMSLVK